MSRSQHPSLRSYESVVRESVLKALTTHPEKEWRELAPHLQVVHDGEKVNLSFGAKSKVADALEFGTATTNPSGVLRNILARCEEAAAAALERHVLWGE